MPYNNFTVEEVSDKFDLVFKAKSFLPELAEILPSNWLKETLVKTLPLTKMVGSEKARSEFIIAPILVELRGLANDEISIFSGREFNVDRELGLNGICDFLISKSSDQLTLSAPILALVEAKKGVLEDGWGQCIAEMVAAQKFNEHKGKPIQSIYGIVTSGSLWHFLQMQGNSVLLDPNEYSLSPLEKLLAVLNWMVRVEPENP
jgi:hypothetical protein